MIYDVIMVQSRFDLKNLEPLICQVLGFKTMQLISITCSVRPANIGFFLYNLYIWGNTDEYTNFNLIDFQYFKVRGI